MSAAALEKRIQDRTATVAVIGLGYVGLPLVRAFVGKGFNVIACDIDLAKITRLTAGKSYISHIGDDVIAGLTASGKFHTDHDGVDYARLVADAKLVVDTRNATKTVADPAKIVKA